MKKFIVLLVVVLPFVALLYFSLSRDPRVLPSALLGKPAPSFTLQTLDGKTVSLEGLQGKPIVLNFWSTWCGPCLEEHRVIKQAVARYGKSGVLFYSVLYEDTVENAERFIETYGEAAPVLLDPGLKTAIDYGVAGVPETFFIDAKGRVIYKHAGVLTHDLLAERVSLLQ